MARLRAIRSIMRMLLKIAVDYETMAGRTAPRQIELGQPKKVSGRRKPERERASYEITIYDNPNLRHVPQSASMIGQSAEEPIIIEHVKRPGGPESA